MPDLKTGKTLRGDLFVEALNFYLDCCHHAEADDKAPMDAAWNSYSEEEQFALAIAMGASKEGLAMIQSYVILHLILQTEQYDKHMSEREAAEILVARRKRRKDIAARN